MKIPCELRHYIVEVCGRVKCVVNEKHGFLWSDYTKLAAKSILFNVCLKPFCP